MLSPRSSLALAFCMLLLAPSAAGADWSGPFDVSAPGSSRREARVAVEPSGAAVVAWLARDGSAAVLQARRIEADGTRGPILDLSPTGRIPAAPDVAMDARGNATVVWSDRGAGIEEIVRARRITAAGTGDVLGDLAVDAAGNATVVWIGPSGASRATFLRRLPATGVPGPVNDLWFGGDDADPRLVLDGAGTPTLIWANSTPTVSTVRARTAPPGAPFGPIADLWPPSTVTLAGEPSMASNAAGEITAVWRRLDSTEEAIVAARFTPAAPATGQSSLAPPASAPPAGLAPGDAVAAVKTCRVPKLKGLTLAKARKRLKRAGCTV